MLLLSIMHMRERTLLTLKLIVLPSMSRKHCFYSIALSGGLQMSRFVCANSPSIESFGRAQSERDFILWCHHPLPHPQAQYKHNNKTHTHTSINTYASHFRIQQQKIAIHLNCFDFIMQMSTFGYE